MKDKPDITFIVPALNEEKNLVAAVDEALGSLDENIFGGCEILIFDDGSSDNTGRIAEDLAAKDKNIRVVHNGTTKGFGYNYREGVRQATRDYVILVPGDNEIPRSTIKEVLRHAGEADIVIPYIKNKEVRSLFRRIVSRAGLTVVNFLFGLKIKYYNGPVLHKAEIIKSVPLSTNGFAYQIEALVQLLKSGFSYVEVGINIKVREYGSTKIFRIKNLASVARTIIRLFWEINFRRQRINRERYSYTPNL